MTVRITTLQNGLRVATDTMDHVETVSLGVWVGVGTRNERPEVNGVAHLVEHMVFKGTARRSAFMISQEIENVGGHLNAYTTRDHTAYYAKVLREDVELALDIIADMLQRSLFDADELGRERAVVLQEIGQSVDTPDDIIFDHVQAVAYPDQALGRPVLGTPEIVSGLSRDALIDYLATQYGAGDMVLAAAGRIEHDALVAMAARLFGDLPYDGRAADEQARYVGGDFREERDLEQLHLILGFEGVGYHDPDYYAHSITSTLLGGGMSSRLFQEVREKRGLVYSIHSFSTSFQDGGMFGIYAGTGASEAGELLPVVCDELAGLADTVTDQEIDRARAQLRAGMLMSLESTTARCEQLAQQLLVYGRPITTEEVVARLAAVDRDGVRRCARRLLQSRPTLAALGPTSGLEDYERFRRRLT